MRATVLLSISALALGVGCGRSQKVELTGKLVMSRVPGDWCGATNPDNIRLDCPFDVGLYVIDASTDAGTGAVLQTVCVSMDADPMRKWGNFTDSLNSAMARLDKIAEGRVRIEVVGVEPKAGNNCDYEASVANASLYGRSNPLELMGSDVPNRYDIATKCLKPFTPTAMCIP